MSAKFFQPVWLINVYMEDKAINVHEFNKFLYHHFAVPDMMTCITGYALSGDVPPGLYIDSIGDIRGNKGKSGDRAGFLKQPYIPSELPLIDASNWSSCERNASLYRDYNFTVTVFWKKELDDTLLGPTGCSTEGSTSKPCTIRLVKNHNIDNFCWTKWYTELWPLGEGQTPSPQEDPF